MISKIAAAVADKARIGQPAVETVEYLGVELICRANRYPRGVTIRFYRDGKLVSREELDTWSET